MLLHVCFYNNNWANSNLQYYQLLSEMFEMYLNFADSDKVSILLNNGICFQGASIFEPG